jgi:hypothetical protein
MNSTATGPATRFAASFSTKFASKFASTFASTSRSLARMGMLTALAAASGCMTDPSTNATGGRGGPSGTGGAGGAAGTGGGAGGTGGGAAGSGGAPAAVSFAREIKPVFAALCNDCHHPASAIGYDLINPFDPAKGIINRENSWVPNGSKQTKVVDPGNVANSFLITKVVETMLDDHVDGAPMPFNFPRFSQAEIDVVSKWIMDGARNDAYFTGSVAPLFGTGISLSPSVSGRCTFCHYPNAPSGMNVLDVFDAAQGMVNRRSRYGGMIVAPGDPANSVLIKKLTGATAGDQMPLHRRRVTAAEADSMRRWITAGAPNN